MESMRLKVRAAAAAHMHEKVNGLLYCRRISIQLGKTVGCDVFMGP